MKRYSIKRVFRQILNGKELFCNRIWSNKLKYNLKWDLTTSIICPSSQKLLIQECHRENIIYDELVESVYA